MEKKLEAHRGTSSVQLLPLHQIFFSVFQGKQSKEFVIKNRNVFKKTREISTGDSTLSNFALFLKKKEKKRKIYNKIRNTTKNLEE